MCDDDSVCLPPGSIDLAFMCDVYHHFEYPVDTMKSIQSALSDNGRVVLIDFERIPGVYDLDHDLVVAAAPMQRLHRLEPVEDVAAGREPAVQ